jgi:hypothetical protein
MTYESPDMAARWWRERQESPTDRVAAALADRLHLTVIGSRMTKAEYRALAEVVIAESEAISAARAELT